MVRSLCINFICTSLLTPFILSYFVVATAQMMGSENYQMESDSINVSGGSATSTNFILEDTTGEVATGPSDSETFALRAGFQQMQEVLISLSDPDPVLMNPSIPGVAGGFSNGSTSVTIITDNPAGYELTITATADPALQAAASADTIADYVPSGSSDYTFTTDPTDAHLGYTVVSPHAADRFFTDGASCSAGSLNTGENCWDGLTTVGAEAARSTSANHPDGTTTELYFRVGVGGSVVQPPGLYVATTTVTAIPL